jgi:hypothetical protein
MSRKTREQTGRQTLAATMSAQFDRALSEAAETMEILGLGWDDIGPGEDDGDGGDDLLPLEFQLDLLLQERDRILYGETVYAETGAAAADGGAEAAILKGT